MSANMGGKQKNQEPVLVEARSGQVLQDVLSALLLGNVRTPAGVLNRSASPYGASPGTPFRVRGMAPSTKPCELLQRTLRTTTRRFRHIRSSSILWVNWSSFALLVHPSSSLVIASSTWHT